MLSLTKGGITMATITEDYCSYEVAKLLKGKRFDWECISYYIDDEPDDIKYSFCGETNSIWESRCCSAPTHQMAMKWLREIHQYIIEIHYGDVGSPKEPKIQWWWELENKQGEFLDGNITDGNTTYEEACEAAIKYCLEHLI